MPRRCAEHAECTSRDGGRPGLSPVLHGKASLHPKSQRQDIGTSEALARPPGSRVYSSAERALQFQLKPALQLPDELEGQC